MATWYQHLEQLDQGPQGWTCRERVLDVLAGEKVEDVTATTLKDICDDGHVHTDVTLGIRTPTRVVHVVAGDAQHVTDEHELGLQCAVTSVALQAISDVTVLSWVQDDAPAVEVRIARAGGGWQAMGDIHDCGDPGCEIPPGSIQLEARSDGLVLLASGPQAGELTRFAGRLARVVSKR